VEIHANTATQRRIVDQAQCLPTLSGRLRTAEPEQPTPASRNGRRFRRPSAPPAATSSMNSLASPDLLGACRSARREEIL